MASSSKNAFAATRQIRNLVIIEAPGKLAALTFALKRAGLENFHVLATQGHVMDYPHDLQQLGIDSNLKEPGRHNMRPLIVKTIGQWAERAERVLIATDADQEGDVLALDLLDHAVPEHPNVRRVRLRALDVDGIALAFSNPEALEPRDAWPGAARRIMDRLIGAAFSGDGAHGKSVAAGRVQSGLLGAASAQELPLGRATLILPACNSRDPYVAVVDVYPHNRQRVEDLLGECQKFIDAGGCVGTGPSQPAEPLKPWCYAQGVLATAEATNRSVEDVAASMQRLYENGRMSYPRSGANALTPQAVGRIEKIADRNGIRIEAGRIAQFTRQSRHAHESPHPLGMEADLSSPMLLLSQDEAVLSMLARHLVACGQPHLMHRPDPSTLPAWSQGLDFKRVSTTWLNPWPRRRAEAGYKPVAAVEHALQLILSHGLGRPSTQVGHAVKFAGRGLLDANMQLTDRAKSWIKGTPAILLDPAVSGRIEKILSDSAEQGSHAPAPATLVRDLIEGLGLWPAVEAALDRGAGLKSAMDHLES